MGFLLESPVQIVRFSHPHLSTRRGALQNGGKIARRFTENFIRVLGADPKGVLNGFTRDLPELRNSLGALGLRLTGPKAPKNPFTLAMAILATSDGLNGISRKYGPGPLPAQPVVEVIERHLKPFLVADWQRRRDDAGHNHASGEDELAAEIRRRA
jgi:hypothetical protein